MSRSTNGADDDPKNGKVTAESYGSLHVEDANKECWMLRVPPRLAEVWDTLPEGTVLGDLVFVKGGKQGATTVKPQLRIDVTPPDPEVFAKHHRPKTGNSKAGGRNHHHQSSPIDSLPLQYTLQAMTKKIPTLHPFTRHPNGSVTIKGTVTRTANLQVSQINDSNYRNLVKNRLLNATVNTNRFVRPVEANQVVQQSRRRTAGGGKSSASGSGFSSAVHEFGKRMLEARDTTNAPVAKKTKFTDDMPTRSVLFELFEQQQYWSVKDLKIASGGRNENEIRDTLREIGEYHRSGDHKNTWELRKEFQKTASSSAAAAASGAGSSAGGSGVGGGKDK